jgi:hypothetical protein
MFAKGRQGLVCYKAESLPFYGFGKSNIQVRDEDRKAIKSTAAAFSACLRIIGRQDG